MPLVSLFLSLSHSACHPPLYLLSTWVQMTFGFYKLSIQQKQMLVECASNSCVIWTVLKQDYKTLSLLSYTPIQWSYVVRIMLCRKQCPWVLTKECLSLWNTYIKCHTELKKATIPPPCHSYYHVLKKLLTWAKIWISSVTILTRVLPYLNENFIRRWLAGDKYIPTWTVSSSGKKKFSMINFI